MAEEIVRIIKIDTKNSGKSINDLKNDIKRLKAELNSTVTGTAEFQAKLQELTTVQKQYAQINETIRAQAQTQSKQMFHLAKFGESLAKSYSAVNAAINLLARDDEDLNKALATTARTIQLIQGLSGFKDLIPEAKKLIDMFSGLKNIFNPIAKQIDQSVDRLMDVNKVNLPNAAGGGVAGKASAAAGGTVITNNTQIIQQQTEALEAQGRTIVPLNEKWQAYNDELIAAQKAMIGYTGDMNKLSDIISIYNQHTTQAKMNVGELNDAISLLLAGKPEKLHKLLKDFTFDEDALRATAKELNVSFDQLATGLHNLEDNLGDDSKILADIKADLDSVSTSAQTTTKSVNGLSKAWGAFWQVIKTVGWTLLITALVTAAYKLVDLIKRTSEARREMAKFNKEIREQTAKSVAGTISTLQQLAKTFRTLGNEAAKEQFLLDYRDKLDSIKEGIDNVDAAEDLLVKNTDTYIKALMDRGRALATENAAAKLYEDYLTKRLELEDKLANPELTQGDQTSSAYVLYGGGWVDQRDLEAQQAVADQAREAQANKIKKDLDQLTTDINERLKKLYTESDTFWQRYWDVFGHHSPNGGNDDNNPVKDQTEAELKELKAGLEQIRDSRLDEEVKEYRDTAAYYDRLIELAKKYGYDTVELEEAKQKAIADLDDKYEKLGNDKEEKERKDEIDRIKDHIKNIRALYATSNLRDPRQQRFQTTYTQGFSNLLGLNNNPNEVGKYRDQGTRGTFLNVYQSRDDVNTEYEKQIEYNNKILELTRTRIQQENDLLKQQLDLETTDADARMEIQRTLAENTIALQDAEQKNAEDNLAAFQSVQQKRQEAMNATFDVASEVMGAMSVLVGEETAVGKGFAVAQATIDTYKAANSAYAAMSGIPYVGPALGIAAAAAAIASGIANVKQILKAGSELGLSASMSASISGSSVQAPAGMIQAPITYSRELLGDKELDKLNDPIKCYVLESDITKKQNKVRVTEENASF